MSFFRNDTEKIHNLLEVIMDEAHKNIGVELGGGVMSLQLAPQPDHSILLTVSSGKEDFGNMLKQAGERAAKALGDRSKSESNVIKFMGIKRSERSNNRPRIKLNYSNG